MWFPVRIAISSYLSRLDACLDPLLLLVGGWLLLLVLEVTCLDMAALRGLRCRGLVINVNIALAIVARRGHDLQEH